MHKAMTNRTNVCMMKIMALIESVIYISHTKIFRLASTNSSPTDHAAKRRWCSMLTSGCQKLEVLL